MSNAADFEGLLRQALAPVEPPAHLASRLEDALQSITELAAGELETWELKAMRDPRNWARPAAALIASAGAGAALMLLRARRREPGRSGLKGGATAVERAAGEMRSQAARLLSRR